MPDQYQYVKLPNGEYGKFRSDASDSVIRAQIEKDFPEAYKGESGVKKFGRGTALGGFSGLGIPESMSPIQDLISGLKQQTVDLLKRAPGEFGSPGGVAGAEGFRLIKNIGGGLARATAEASEGAGADPNDPSRFGPMDLEKLGHGLGSLFTQILMLKGGKEAAETPISEGITAKTVKALPDVPKTGARELLGIGEKSVERERAATEKTAAAEKATAQKKYAEDYAANQKEKVEQSKAEGKKQAYEVLRDKKAKELVQNLDKTDQAIKTAFDAEYGDFDTKILGKSKANPKGTLESDLSSFAQKVKDVKANLIEGSPEKIKQFESIIDLAEKSGDRMDMGEGKLGVAPGKTIPTVDLRGFVTELQSRIYSSELLPDVRNALKTIAEAGKAEISATVERNFGKGASTALKDLNSRYSQYLTDWRDSSSANPLPKIQQLLHEPVRKGTPQVPIWEKVAPLFEGTNGNVVLPVLAKYRKFGADLGIADSYRRAEVAAREAPKAKTVETLERPKPPETKPFSPEEFRKEKIGKKAESLSNLSMWDIAGISGGMEEFLRGHPLYGASAISIPIIKRLLARGLSKEGVIDWLAKEGGPTP